MSGARHRVEGVVEADGFRSRMIGLMGRKDLSRAFLWIPRCNSVHTFFMRGPIDLLFLDRERKVTRQRRAVPPWRLVLGGMNANSTLELPSGYIERHNIDTGDLIEWSD